MSEPVVCFRAPRQLQQPLLSHCESIKRDQCVFYMDEWMLGHFHTRPADLHKAILLLRQAGRADYELRIDGELVIGALQHGKGQGYG